MEKGFKRKLIEFGLGQFFFVGLVLTPISKPIFEIGLSSLVDTFTPITQNEYSTKTEYQLAAFIPIYFLIFGLYYVMPSWALGALAFAGLDKLNDG